MLKNIMDTNENIIPRIDIARAVFESLTHMQQLNSNHGHFLNLIVYMIDNFEYCNMLAGATRGAKDDDSVASSSTSTYTFTPPSTFGQ